MAEQTATIANGQTASNNIELCGAVAGSVQLPAAITGTALTIKGSIDGVTYTEVVEEGGESNPLVVAAAGTYALPIKTFSYKYLQLVMDAQGAARSISVYLRKP